MATTEPVTRSLTTITHAMAVTAILLATALTPSLWFKHRSALVLQFRQDLQRTIGLYHPVMISNPVELWVYG
jgi:hypothetical protein